MNSQSDHINCWIYKSSRKEEMYLYLADENGLDEIPEALKQSFGETVFVMELELSAQRQLARADIEAVIQSLKEEGFYLQMPPKLDPDLYFGD